MTDAPRIVGISGSLRTDSNTRLLVEDVLARCREQGAKTSFVDLRRKDLPFCDGRSGDSYGVTTDSLVSQMKRADAFVIGTPEYHGGYSGVLKNFLDLMPVEAFRGKLVALVGAGGGRFGAENALNQLRTVFKNLEAWVLPVQTTVGKGDIENGEVMNPVILTRLEDQAGTLMDRLKPDTAAAPAPAEKPVSLWQRLVSRMRQAGQSVIGWFRNLGRGFRRADAAA